MTNQIELEQRDDVLVARIDNPPHNFMNAETVAELDALAARVEEEPAIGAVVLTGAHPDAFVTHFDVEEIVSGAEDAGKPISPSQASRGVKTVRAARRLPRADAALERSQMSGVLGLLRGHEMALRIERSDATFIAALNGRAMGGGLELALACDLRIAARGSGPFGLPETGHGLIPGAGGTQRLARTVGAATAIEMILEARLVDAEQALELGLVHRLADPGRLLDDALETASRLAKRSPEAVAAAKRAVYGGYGRPLEEGLGIETEGFLTTASSYAAREAMRSYVAEIEAAGADPDFATAMAGWRDGERTRMRARG